MAEYGISEQKVERCLQEYHTRRSTETGNPKFVAEIEGGRIMVIVEAESDLLLVITVGD